MGSGTYEEQHAEEHGREQAVEVGETGSLRVPLCERVDHCEEDLHHQHDYSEPAERSGCCHSNLDYQYRAMLQSVTDAGNLLMVNWRALSLQPEKAAINKLTASFYLVQAGKANARGEIQMGKCKWVNASR